MGSIFSETLSQPNDQTSFLIQKDVLLNRFSTFLIGGKADFLTYIETTIELEKAVLFAEEKKIPFLILGGGSNILFSDKGFRGLIIVMKNSFVDFLGDGRFVIGAGTRNMDVYSKSKQEGYDFSVFYTVPGTIGGAVFGNAGLPSGEIKDFFVSAMLFNTHEKKWEVKQFDFFDFEYRKTLFHSSKIRKKYVIWAVELLFSREKISPSQIDKKAKEYLALRKQKQPWGKTGGSFFKNPTQGAAGYFLEQVGMKGYKNKGAFFSEKHANFMMNDGIATQNDIVCLAKKAKEKVFDQFGVDLNTEVRILDEFGNNLRI